jgi:hypothetical protein
MKKTLTTISAFALVAVLFTMAYAAVTLDTDSGIGFAGKGDVAAALGVHEKNLASSYVFAYEENAEYELQCSGNQGQTSVIKPFKKTSSQVASQEGTARTNKNNVITGYRLEGWTDEELEGDASCPGGFPTLVSSTQVGTSSGGTLTVDGKSLEFTKTN